MLIRTGRRGTFARSGKRRRGRFVEENRPGVRLEVGFTLFLGQRTTVRSCGSDTTMVA